MGTPLHCGHLLPSPRSRRTPRRLPPGGLSARPAAAPALEVCRSVAPLRRGPSPHLVRGPSTRNRIGCCSTSQPLGTARPRRRRCHTVPRWPVPPGPRGRCPVSLGVGGSGAGGAMEGVPYPDLQPPEMEGSCPLLPCPARRGAERSHLGMQAGRCSHSRAGSTSPRRGTRRRAGTRLCSRSWGTAQRGQGRSRPSLQDTEQGGCGAPAVAARTRAAAWPPAAAPLAPWARQAPQLAQGWYQTPLPRGGGLQRGAALVAMARHIQPPPMSHLAAGHRTALRTSRCSTAPRRHSHCCSGTKSPPARLAQPWGALQGGCMWGRGCQRAPRCIRGPTSPPTPSLTGT